MAENKKSFILYCDTLQIVKKLTDQQAGKLLKTIVSYVNDENPQIDNLVIEIAFEPIKQQLKRDLKRYEAICERNKTNGKIGGRPAKKNPKKPKKPNGLIGNPKNLDNDNDNDIKSSNEDYNISSHTQSEIDFSKFKEWILEHAHQVSKMKEPFTIEEFERLKVDFDVGFIQRLLTSMHNYKPLLQKNLNANLTFRNWAKRETHGQTFKPTSKASDIDAVVGAMFQAAEV